MPTDYVNHTGCSSGTVMDSCPTIFNAAPLHRSGVMPEDDYFRCLDKAFRLITSEYAYLGAAQHTSICRSFHAALLDLLVEGNGARGCLF